MSTHTYHDLHKYQKIAIATGVNLKTVAFFLGTGLGKTIIYLAIIDQLKKRDLIENALLISTKKVIYNTIQQEALEWAGTKKLSFSIIHGRAHRGMSAEDSRRQGFYSGATVKLINYEGLPWLAKHLKAHRYDHINNKFPFQCIIYDESTKIKHSNTKRFRSLKPLMGMFEYRFLGTGTPVPNGLMDLFGQMYALDLGVSLGTVMTNYRDRYMTMTAAPEYGSKGRYVPRKTAKQAIQKRIKDKVVYMKKSDYLQLPPLHYNPIRLDLPDRFREQYNTLEEEFFFELGEARVEAFSQAALSSKLRQFLQGNMYQPAEGGRITLNIHREKLDYLEEMSDSGILEGVGNCIIAYNFKFEREDLLSVFPDAPVIDGSSSDDAVTQAIEGWNRQQHPVMLFNPASDPHGLNLQFGGNNILWYSLTWNLEHYMQLIDRLHRQLQTKPVMVHHLLFRDTLDEVIFSALTAKDRAQSSLLTALKRHHETATGVSQEER